MVQHDRGVIDGLVASLTNAKAVVRIVARHGKTRVEAADLLKDRSAGSKARARYCRRLVRQMMSAKVARIGRMQPHAVVPRVAIHAQEDACVLNGAVLIEQARSHRSNVRPNR